MAEFLRSSNRLSRAHSPTEERVRKRMRCTEATQVRVSFGTLRVPHALIGRHAISMRFSCHCCRVLDVQVGQVHVPCRSVPSDTGMHPHTTDGRQFATQASPDGDDAQQGRPRIQVPQDEYLRLLQRSIEEIGFPGIAHDLAQASGVQAECLPISTLRTHVLGGRWLDAVSTLESMQGEIVPDSYSKAKFLLLKQHALQVLPEPFCFVLSQAGPHAPRYCCLLCVGSASFFYDTV